MVISHCAQIIQNLFQLRKPLLMLECGEEYSTILCVTWICGVCSFVWSKGESVLLVKSILKKDKGDIAGLGMSQNISSCCHLRHFPSYYFCIYLSFSFLGAERYFFPSIFYGHYTEIIYYSVSHPWYGNNEIISLKKGKGIFLEITFYQFAD